MSKKKECLLHSTIHDANGPSMDYKVLVDACTDISTISTVSCILCISHINRQ